MNEIEIERTFLVKSLPSDLKTSPHKTLLDIYLPTKSMHPVLRVRQKGDSFEMTKKVHLDEGDASEQQSSSQKMNLMNLRHFLENVSKRFDINMHMKDLLLR